MSLRTLQGIRINGLRGASTEAAGWLAVGDLQRALHAFVHETWITARQRVADPGSVDGVWGSRTEASLAAALAAGAFGGSIDNIEISDDRRRIKAQRAVQEFIADYLPSFTSSMVSGGGGGSPDSPVVVNDPTAGVPNDSLDIASDDYIYYPGGRSFFSRIPWWGWLLIAVAASGAGYGAYYWWKKNKRRR